MNAAYSLDSVADALRAGQRALDGHSDSARLDAEVLLARTLGKDRAWLYANPDGALSPRQGDVFRAFVLQRLQGRPLAQLTGRREFWSLELEVNEHTLVPRPETELLVELALERIPDDSFVSVLDLGTGSGAIAVALARERSEASVTATDLSRPALEVARLNAEHLCPGRIRFCAGSWFAALPEGSPRFDIIVSNPPYIAANETPLTDPELAYEPAEALYSGRDGLDAIRQIIGDAPSHLNPGGWLLLEHGYAQSRAVTGLLTAAGFEAVATAPDLAGNPRVSMGRKP